MIDVNQAEKFQNGWVHPFLPQKEWTNFGRVESRTSWQETKSRYKSNWPKYVTRMNNNRMPKIILNYRPNGRRWLGRPLKRLLDRMK